MGAQHSTWQDEGVVVQTQLDDDLLAHLAGPCVDVEPDSTLAQVDTYAWRGLPVSAGSGWYGGGAERVVNSTEGHRFGEGNSGKSPALRQTHLACRTNRPDQHRPVAVDRLEYAVDLEDATLTDPADDDAHAFSGGEQVPSERWGSHGQHRSLTVLDPGGVTVPVTLAEGDAHEGVELRQVVPHHLLQPMACWESRAGGAPRRWAASSWSPSSPSQTRGVAGPPSRSPTG